MHIFHFYPKLLPVKGYGGTQRIAYNLMTELVRLGHKVSVACFKGSKIPGAEVIPLRKKEEFNFEKYIPAHPEIIQFYFTPKRIPTIPYLVRIGGILKPGEKYLPNTVFVSRAHASRNNSKNFIYSGINVDELIYQEKKEDYFLFLSHVSAKAKNVKLAVKLARDMGFKLIVAGGWRPSFRRNIKFVGEVDGIRKARLFAGAKALIFPTRCPEPIGNVTLEAMASGTPVITTNNGAMPEIVTEEVGFCCDTYEEFKEAIRRVDKINPEKCRKRVVENFTKEIMTRKYIEAYQKIITTGHL